VNLRRIQFPGRTLIIDSTDARYAVLSSYFHAMWVHRFVNPPELSLPDRLLRGKFRFFRILWHFIAIRYSTIIFLTADHRADRTVKWAAFIARIKNRAGFAPLKNFEPLNFSLPFNTENHHVVHQLKIFFEYLVGEKVHDWKKPALRAEPTIELPQENFGVVAFDASDPALPYLREQLTKFINGVARSNAIVVLVEAPDEIIATALLRQITQNLTDKAIERTTFLTSATDGQILTAVSRSAWACGVSARTLNIAALAEVPTISIFGPLNERVWQPFSTRSRALTGEFDCRPCTKYPGSVVCTNPHEWQCVSGASAELLAATVGALSRRAAK